MTDLKLDLDEGLLLQTTSVELYKGEDELDVYELYLTNKQLICVYGKSTGFFSKEEICTEYFPLISIKVVNGQVQVAQVEHEDYGTCMQVLFTKGSIGRFVFSDPKRELPVWVNAVTKAVLKKPEASAEPTEKKHSSSSTGSSDSGVAGATSEATTSHSSVNCAKCGEALKPGSQFCNACGTPVGGRKNSPKSNNSDTKRGSSSFTSFLTSATVGFRNATNTARKGFAALASELTETEEEHTNGSTPLSQVSPFENVSSSNEYAESFFCVSCGTKLSAGIRFCPACGQKAGKSGQEQYKTSTENTAPTEPAVTFEKESNYTEHAQRKTVYDGEIHKCPNCGELLKSFALVCPACGLELRGKKAASAVREFALKLETIEAHREYEKPRGLFAHNEAMQRISKTDEQKISLIRNFVIPNTKEDILEFMILATSYFDSSLPGSTDTPTAGQKAMTEAWSAKIKQAYNKARNLYGTDSDFTKVKELYDTYLLDIKKSKKKKAIKWFLLLGWLPLLLFFVIVLARVSERKDENTEIARLESIVAEVEENLEDGEYTLALRNADSIDYQRYEIEMERKWDIQREYWVNKVLETAFENGVVLDYTYSEDIDNANKDSDESTESHGGFIEGFKEGIQND